MNAWQTSNYVLEEAVKDIDVRYHQLCMQLRNDLNAMPTQTMTQLVGIEQELAEAKHQTVFLAQRLDKMTQEAERVVADQKHEDEKLREALKRRILIVANKSKSWNRN